MKVLSFHEDYRPPYKGTFSKTSTVLTGRNPFEKDHNVFNYDFDSEGEWEEGDGEGNNSIPYYAIFNFLLDDATCIFFYCTSSSLSC
jgi:Chromatin assembly factor 1 subunit A